MDNGYKNIFWGLFLSTFNITIGPIKILPAFIGFLLISSGIDWIKSRNNNKNLDKAYLYCNCLAGISFISTIGAFTGLYIADLNVLSREVNLIFTNIIMLLELLTIYHLLVGSREVFEDKNIDTINILEKSIKKYIIIYSLVVIILNISNIFVIYEIMLYVGILVILIRVWLLIKFGKLRKDYIDR